MKMWGITNTGLVRSENQDAYAVFEAGAFHAAVVCDGMGGTNGGQVASAIAVARFEKELRDSLRDDMDIPQLRQAINLLQLSNVELNELLAKELDHNPFLERENDRLADAEDGKAPTIDDYPSAGETPAAEEDFAPDIDCDNEFDDFASDREGYEGGSDYSWDEYAASKTRSPDDEFDFFEKKLSGRKSLYELLDEQISLNFSVPRDKVIASRLTAFLDESGYFRGDTEEIAAKLNLPSEEIEKIDEVLSYHLFPPREDGSDPRVCPECGKGRLSVKLGKFGAFLGCSNYPECKYTKPLTDVKEEEMKDTPRPANPEDKVLGEMNSLKVYLKKGPYGYYVQLGEDATATTEKPRRSSLPKFLKPEDVTLEQASTLLSLPKQLGNGIEVNIGKFGQYLKQGGKSKSLTGNDNIFNITLERAEEILKGVAERPAGKILGQHPKDKADITLNSGRYGPYLKWGRNNYAIPKEYRDKELTLDDALKIISAKK